MKYAIEVKGLTKTYKTRRKVFEAVKGINFNIKEGEIFGYLGPNGAGKTTTLKCILGLLFPEKGKIEIFGYPHLHLKAKERVGFLPENPYFYDYLTASEFLRFYSYLFSQKKKEEKIDNLLSLVGLEKSADLQLRKFSRGMLQRTL